jgi:SAM-dependent methyltransferase
MAAISQEENVILSMLHGMWQNRCLSVLVGFKIPEILCNTDEPSVSIEDIAAKTGCSSSERIYPIMRLLAQWGIGKELENKRFAKNKAMELLRRDNGPSLGDMIAHYCSDEYFTALRSFPEAVRTNRSAFLLEHGMKDLYEYMNEIENSPYGKDKQFKGTSEHPIGSDERRRELATCCNKAQAMRSQLQLLPNAQEINNVYNVFPWSKCKRLLDAGGSSGYFLASILKQPDCQNIQGFVADLPAVVDNALKNYKNLGIPENRIIFMKQDFMKPFPDNFQVDTVIFKNTLVSFDDSTTIKILRNFHTLFLKEGGKILILTTCVADAGVLNQNIGINGLQPGVFAVHVSILFNGVYRTRDESAEYFKEIGNQSGFRLSEIYDTFLGGITMFELSCIL